MPGHDDHEAVWNRILEAIRGRINASQYETWFTKTQCVVIEADRVAVEVPNHFYSDWLGRQYRSIIEDSIESVLGHRNARIEFQTGAVASPASLPTTVSTAEPAPTSVEPPPPQAGAWTPEDDDRLARSLDLNPHYTFENFVVGPSNRLVHAASLAVIEDTGKVYNPLFVHGGLGLGKTHLLQGICHVVLKRRPDVRIRYIPCEKFVNQFIAAMGRNRLVEFRDHYRRLDILVIDDIHFLASKDHSQEEFFHTFNALYDNQKQIILSSDSAPKDIPTIEERLVSRFKWGLVCEIEPPTFETRMSIVRKKARLNAVGIPDEVTEFLAGSIQGNVRELEGAVTRLLGFASIMKRTINLETAKEALGDMIGSIKRRVTIDQIVALVTEYYGVRLADLQSKKRFQSIALPRQVCMYLARQNTPLSLAEIGGYFGGRDHSTVLYAIDKISKSLKRDLELRSAIQDMRRRLEV
ncbi:MAG: chromosomal replication initiator protein DnaA [Planctomycetes bacterium]|nr:chromosomal replication initiator protein DnaA [Planctomycetota bacterium]